MVAVGRFELRPLSEVFGSLVGPAQAASRSFLARLIPEGKNGEIFGIVAQPLYDECKGSAELLFKMANGEKVPYWTVLEAPLVTKDNMDEFYGILDRLEPRYRDAKNPDEK